MSSIRHALKQWYSVEEAALDTVNLEHLSMKDAQDEKARLLSVHPEEARKLGRKIRDASDVRALLAEDLQAWYEGTGDFEFELEGFERVTADENGHPVLVSASCRISARSLRRWRHIRLSDSTLLAADDADDQEALEEPKGELKGRGARSIPPLVGALSEALVDLYHQEWQPRKNLKLKRGGHVSASALAAVLKERDIRGVLPSRLNDLITMGLRALDRAKEER